MFQGTTNKNNLENELSLDEKTDMIAFIHYNWAKGEAATRAMLHSYAFNVRIDISGGPERKETGIRAVEL